MAEKQLISESFLTEVMSLPDSGANQRRRNLIEIAGYPDWENVNSNFLAFYFDPDEDHGFGMLFLRSLLDLCNQSPHYDENLIQDFSDNVCEIEREFPTAKNGRVDIVIRTISQGDETEEDTSEEPAPKAAIIIENKINAYLHNDLKDYYDSVSADRKIGVVLCIRPPETLRSDFIAITHRSLIDQVMQNLEREDYMNTDDRHLLFLKEYIANVDRFYRSPEEEQKMKDVINLFHKHKSEIQKLHSKEKELGNHITDSVNRVMKENGFPPAGTKRNPKSKHYRPTADSPLPSGLSESDRKLLQKFRVFVNLSRMKYEPIFEAYFELLGKENVRYGSQLRKRVSEQLNEGRYINVGGGDGTDYYHIFCIELPFSLEDHASLGDALKERLESQFFNSRPGYVQTAVAELKKLVPNPS